MSNNYAPSYQTNSWEDWYQHFYNTPYTGQSLTRPTDMSDADWDYGRALQTGHQNAQRINDFYDTNTSLLNQNYSTAKNALDQNKAVAQQNASVAYDKLKKYLPMQMKAQGLAGLGVSETASLQALNNYSSEMGKIASDHASEMTKLDQAYGEQLTSHQQKRDELLYNADKDANGNLLTDNVLKEYEAKEENEFNANFNAAMTAIGESSYSTEAEMQAFVEKFRGRVTDAQFDTLLQVGKGMVDATNAEKAETDRANAYDVAYPTLEQHIQNGRFDLAVEFLEANKDTFGDSVYQAYMGTIQGGLKQISSDIDTFFGTEYPDISSRKAAYDKIMGNLKYAKGALPPEEYEALNAKMAGTSSPNCSGGWYIQGLGSGRENDDIDITIGSTSRNENTEYDLLCGPKVTDGNIITALNKLATGDETKYPKVESGWTWLHGDAADSNSTPGKLVVYMNQMFIYTTNGWKTVVADNDPRQLQDAINAFLASSGSAASATPTASASTTSSAPVLQASPGKGAPLKDLANYLH